jgi:anthranilate synthase component II
MTETVSGSKAHLIVIDNYDSFTFNLIQMFRRYRLNISVYRADKISVTEVEYRSPDYLLISPGPKNPSAAGISPELIRHFHTRIPILGVCLGMQCINEAFGGRTVHAPVPLHGKTNSITHEGHGLFSDIPTPFTVARYHSLAVSNIPDELEVTATAEDHVVMGISHRRVPVHGIQFHPESFLSEHGFGLIENFLRAGPLRSVLT